jgi:hypothetical protein
MNYLKIRNNPKQFIALTTLTVEEFDELVPLFGAKWERYIKRYTFNGKVRQNRYTPKKEDVLSTDEEKLFFILIYKKTNSLQELMAAAFDIDQSLINRWIHLLTPILDDCLEKYQAARTQQALNEQLVEGQTYIADATDREIARPKYKQEENYSNKQKSHTIKNMLIITLTSFVVFLSPTVVGKVHDKRLADETTGINKRVELWLDSGYQGFNPEGVNVEIPHKKPQKRELTRIQKKENQVHARRRVPIEHVNSSVKRLHILRYINRNRKAGYRDKIMNIGVSLHNFRVTKRQTTYL